VAGFEQNQQDAFNARNDADSLKRLQAELDKATVSIGAAELAAEEELATLKLKNLAVQQEAQTKKLDELLKREEAGIRELAALRLELSDKQFEARKKEIQKELQLLEDARNKLREAEADTAKKIEDFDKKQTPSTENSTSASRPKPVPGKKTSLKDSGKTTDPDLIKLVGSIDKTLAALLDTANSSREKGNSTQASTTEDIKGAMQQSQSRASTDGEAEPPKLDSGKNKQPPQGERQYTNDSALLDKVDLGHYSFEAVFSSFDVLRDSLSANISALNVLNQVTTTDENGKAVSSQSTIDFAGDFLKATKKSPAKSIVKLFHHSLQ